MSKQAFEQANEVFVDDKYDEAYEVRSLLNILISSSHQILSFTLKQSTVMIKPTINILRNFLLHVLNVH